MANFNPVKLSNIYGLSIIAAAITIRVYLLHLVYTVEDDGTLFHLEYRDNLLLSIGFTMAVTIKIITEAINHFRRRNKDIASNHCFPSRLLLLLSLQICDASMCGWLDNNRFDAESYKRVCVTILSFKIVALVGCISSIISDHLDSSVHNFDSVMNTSRQLSFLFITTLCFQAMCLSGYGTQSYKSFEVLTFGVLCFAALQVIVLCSCCYLNWFAKYATTEIGTISRREDLVVGICLVMLLLIVASSLYVYSTFLGSGGQGTSSISATVLSVAQFTQLVVTIGVVTVPWQLNEWFLLDFLTATLSENSSFLRYIAHEVRAALNVTELSLTFMKQEMKRRFSRKNHQELGSIIDAIGDADDSCKSAISILNDVLLFDKMRGRWMVLHSCAAI